MALSRIKTWGAEILTDTDLNAEFDNIVNNSLTLISPLTANLACGGFALTGVGNVTLNSGKVLTMTAGPVYWAKGADVASAAALAIGADGNSFDVTGTTTITSIASKQAGTLIFLQFDGALTFTHNATTLALPGNANITTAAGDIAIMLSEGSGNWRCVHYQADVSALQSFPSVGANGTVLTADSSTATGKAWAVTGFTTGDAKLTIKTVADTGWVLMNDGTMGNAASGGTTRANADTVDLFTLLWNNTANAQCAVSTGRGANAAADFAANKTIALPKQLGRALACFGAGAGLTSRALALATGNETATQATGTPSSTLSVDINLTGAVGGAASTTHTHTTTALPIMQPTLFLNVMIKL